MKNEKNTPDAPKNESGFIQLIRMGKSIRHKWVKSDWLNNSVVTKNVENCFMF